MGWFLGWLLFLVAAVLLAMGLTKVECYAKWERSGMPVSWGPMQGCMVQKKDGTWVPASSYRNID